MLTIPGPAGRLCDGVGRRGFLKIGALGLGGLSLADPVPVGAAENRVSVIVFFMAGGPSHIDTYDMKPEAPAEVRGPFRPLRTPVPGLEVCELLPRHVPIARHLAVVRSFTHDLSVHDDATHWVQTGYPLLNARARGQQQPSQGAVVAALRGPNHPDAPAYACVPEDYRTHLGFYEGPAFLGEPYAALNTGVDPTLSRYRAPEFLLPAHLTLERLERRRGLLDTVDGWLSEAECHGALQELGRVRRQAFQLITGSRVREALNLSRESDAVRDRYGRHLYGQSALLSRRLVEAGATYVTINLYQKDVDWWDDHYTIEKNLRQRLPVFDQAFASLIEDLADRGLLERTLVVACGEFGRSPRIDAQAGRGHWPKAMSAVFAGGGVRGGQVVGATTADGGEPAERAVGPGHLLATIYHALGMHWGQSLRDRQGKVVPLVPQGEPLRELFGG